MGTSWRKVGLLAAGSAALLMGCPDYDENFYVNIQREFQTPQEEALIQIAEEVCPYRQDVLDAAYPQDREALEAEAGDNCLWWYGTDWEKVPYAITSDAIDHYAACVDDFRNVESMWGPAFVSAHMDYVATIEAADSSAEGDEAFENAYIVRLTISYFEGTGPVSAWGFGKERQVVLTSEGDVLAVFGDGPTQQFVAKNS